jgi:nucleotide-binding universal stress UspA family protein
MYKKILLATDGSEHSIKAAKRVVELQKSFGAEVVIFHAEKHYYIPEKEEKHGFPFFNLGEDASLKNDYNHFHDQFLIWGEKKLKDTQQLFIDAGLEAEIRLISDIVPSKYAEKIVKAEKFDLVVVGCKGHHSKLREIFIGTVAEKIMNKVDCDSLVIR